MRKLLIVSLILVSSSLSAPFHSVLSASGDNLAQGPQTKRPATFDDVLNLKAVQGATVSPDGSQVIYTVRQWESEQGPRPHNVWTANGRPHARMEGGHQRQFAGAANYLRRKGRLAAAMVAGWKVHQLRVVARRRGGEGADST